MRDEHGNTFRTMEHYIMYHKAMLMNDPPSARLVLAAKHPAQAKVIGRAIVNWDEALWARERESILFRGLMLKARQHKVVRDILDLSGDRIVAEASPYDAIWGTGCSKHVTDPRKWRGTNILGKAWMKVRAELRGDPSLPPHKKTKQDEDFTRERPPRPVGATQASQAEPGDVYGPGIRDPSAAIPRGGVEG